MFFSRKKIGVLGQSYRRHFAQNRCFCCLATNIKLAEKIGENYSNVNKNRKKNIHPQSFLQKLPKTSRAPGKLHQKQGSILLFLPEEQEQVLLNLQLSRSFLNLTKDVNTARFLVQAMVNTIKIILENPTTVGGASLGFRQTIEKSVQEKSQSIQGFEKKTIQKFKYSQFLEMSSRFDLKINFEQSLKLLGKPPKL